MSLFSGVVFRCHLQVFIAVALQGSDLLQVTSDVSQVLYLRLQSLNLTENDRISESNSVFKQLNTDFKRGLKSFPEMIPHVLVCLNVEKGFSPFQVWNMNTFFLCLADNVEV